MTTSRRRGAAGRHDLTLRGRDDAELDEFARLLETYRRAAGGWQRVEIDGQPAYARELDCGHRRPNDGADATVTERVDHRGAAYGP